MREWYWHASSLLAAHMSFELGRFGRTEIHARRKTGGTFSDVVVSVSSPAPIYTVDRDTLGLPTRHFICVYLSARQQCEPLRHH